MNANTYSPYMLCTCGRARYEHQLDRCPGFVHRRFELTQVAELASEACGPACKSGSMGAGHLYCPED
jgi:hypothetical protein